MPLLDTGLVKKHLRVDSTDEDAVIAVYQAAAEATVREYIDREVYLSGDSPVPTDEFAIELEPPITAAILLLIGDFYANREPDYKLGGDAVLPRAVRALLAPYRVWRTVSEGAC